MSYSFTVRARTHQEANDLVVAELAKVAASQPAHEFDKNAAQSAADALLFLLEAPGELEVIQIQVNGSLSWREEGKFTGANLNVSAHLVHGVAAAVGGKVE
jgi:hypothetical protein